MNVFTRWLLDGALIQFRGLSPAPAGLVHERPPTFPTYVRPVIPGPLPWLAWTTYSRCGTLLVPCPAGPILWLSLIYWSLGLIWSWPCQKKSGVTNQGPRIWAGHDVLTQCMRNIGPSPSGSQRPNCSPRREKGMALLEFKNDKREIRDSIVVKPHQPG